MQKAVVMRDATHLLKVRASYHDVHVRRELYQRFGTVDA
jgi:hypothetical protein